MTGIGHWSDHAACKGQDTAKFFPNPSDHEAANWALAWCEACPVRQSCLLSALSTELDGSDMKHGIWGGTTPAERYRMRMSREKEADSG